MEDAKPEGRPPNNDGLTNDGLTNADRVRKCRGNLGTTGTGKTWYVVRDLTIESTGDFKAAIVAVVLGSRRSVQADYPDTLSIALLSGYPAKMRRWIIEQWKLDFGKSGK